MDRNIGVVESVKNEICIVTGFNKIGLSNVVLFSSGSQGIVLGFDDTDAQIIMFKDYQMVKRGDLVRVVAEFPTFVVSEALLGRVVDPLGEPLDGLGALELLDSEQRRIEAIARPVYQRRIIEQPFLTGYAMIDSQIPIGHGQRELLLGERGSGQNDLAVDVICNQKRLNTDVISVYVIIDAETALAKRRIQRIQEAGALGSTVIILGRAAQAASLNYIAPMVGSTVAEWFADRGKKVLLIYDDMTRHAKVYRQLSLLLNRPASREAYPGDIFYLHSRLLERAGAFSERAGGGSITALPIVETQTEEATDYITTNLMSITDGHVLFRKSLSHKGVAPAIDSGFSVSRIGGRAQRLLIRELSEKVRNVFIRYSEIERFLAFGADLSASSRQEYSLGAGAMTLFHQAPGNCFTQLQQAIVLYFIFSKKILLWETSQLQSVRDALFLYIALPPYSDLLTDITLESSLEDATLLLRDCIKDFITHADTPKPIEAAPILSAETEVLSEILREEA